MSRPRTGYAAVVSDTAVLVIDMLNAYSHGDAEPLATNVAQIISPLSALIGLARDHNGIDLIYAHDNDGDFTGDTADIVQAAIDGHRPELVTSIVPQKDSMVLSKAPHSAFYASPLAYLLRRRETKTLILTGQVTDQCILCTALDGYIRHFDVVVPTDAVAHIMQNSARRR